MSDSAVEKFLDDSAHKAQGQDLLELLRDYHRLRLEASIGDQEIALGDQLEAVDEFLEHARDLLRRNPVVTTYILPNGLGVRLQNGKAVPLVHVEVAPLPRNAMAITRPETVAGMEGVSERWSMPITKGE